MKKLKTTIVVLLSLPFFLLLTNNSFGQNKHIEAVILDSLTRQPLKNVKVVINSVKDNSPVKLADAVTNEKGEVYFPMLAQDITYQLVVQLPDYKQKKAYGTFGESKEDFYIKLKLYMSAVN